VRKRPSRAQRSLVRVRLVSGGVPVSSFMASLTKRAPPQSCDDARGPYRLRKSLCNPLAFRAA
jgi:hypothetical protein